MQLLKRFENIIALAPVGALLGCAATTRSIHYLGILAGPKLIGFDRRQIQGTDRNATAVEVYQMEVETSALVRPSAMTLEPLGLCPTIFMKRS